MLPQELGNLRNLNTFYANDNSLNGHIPSSFGHLSNCLTRLDLSNNNINGTIPQELTQLTQLLYLNLSSNLLSGKIPFTIGGLFNLETLDLSNNNIGGLIPTELRNCSNLNTLALNNNIINGTIPSQLGDMPSLYYLNLSHNNLSGILPKSLNVFTHLDVSYNNLSGEISTTICQVANKFVTGNRDLHSSSSCREREALLNTGWWNNNTSDHCKWDGISCNSAGFISEINLIDQGIEGDLSKFNFSSFAKLETLDLASNHLSGTIPPHIAALSTLTVLNLSTNNLRCAIPPEIGNLRNLGWLFLDRNNLTGPIPSTLGQLTNLEELSLYTNQLTEKCDVYSFGMVALEILIGRHPSKLLPFLSSPPSKLPSSDQEIMLIDLLDQRLSSPNDQTVVQDILLISTVAFACLRSNPKSRPTMQHVCQEFLARRMLFKSKSLQEISVSQLQNQEI
ncbi:hypothetical protein EZV62_019285 [Acer yangbiense]|uniref:Uncharacterized protein n=1 Tax=Acer yangbiense TaxID=1000413 RepID=A0A5C7HB38_9ROSI|nr:hypothetical protein EZV62_019285 [Acer yangbiense]